jgi:NADH:ubiquinone oxidoreductase subunit F (NADH-binding)
MLKRKSPSHTAKRGTAEVDFGVGLAWIIHDFAGGKRKGALKD